MLGFTSINSPPIPTLHRINFFPHFPFKSKTHKIPQAPSSRFIRFAQDPNKDQEKQQQNGSSNGDELKKDRRPLFNLKWGDLFDPDPDNLFAVGLTGLLAWASVQVLWQLALISLAILVAALKSQRRREYTTRNLILSDIDFGAFGFSTLGLYLRFLFSQCSVTPLLPSLSPIRRSCAFKLRTSVTPSLLFDLLNRIEKAGDSEETNPYSSKNTVEHTEVGGGRWSAGGCHILICIGRDMFDAFRSKATCGCSMRVAIQRMLSFRTSPSPFMLR
ncbi:hypothetical protein Dsin_000322 [Dipteronia sinensis]|uniref:Uncharacterized protein n=1 Tax=Dipteronia sinensis TaxID=43782 RepID=A0AAE0EHE9_9ROSI|nr:hypothetical protein Dsin_000322 [Dipteronia sinensis]